MKSVASMKVFRFAFIILLLSILIPLLVSSCSDNGPSGPDPGTNPNVVSKEIGPDGGEITSEDGDLTLTFPEGALSSTETITVETLNPDNPPEQFAELKNVTTAYDLGPDGLNFDQPVVVTYNNGKDPYEEDEEFSLPISVMLTEGTDGQPEFLDSLSTGINPETGKIWTIGGLTHFSTIIDVEQENIRVRITGIPETLPKNETFTAHVLINASNINRSGLTVEKVSYHDESILPLTLTEPERNPKELLREEAAFVGEIEYTCIEPENNAIYNAYFTLTEIHIEGESEEDTYKTDLRLLGTPDYGFKSLGGLLPGGPPLANVTCTEPVEPQYSVDASKKCVPGAVTDSGDPLLRIDWTAEFVEHSEGTFEVEVTLPDGSTTTIENDINETGSSSSFEGDGFSVNSIDIPEGPAGTWEWIAKAFTENGDAIAPSEGFTGAIDVNQDEIDNCEEALD